VAFLMKAIINWRSMNGYYVYWLAGDYEILLLKRKLVFNVCREKLLFISASFVCHSTVYLKTSFYERLYLSSVQQLFSAFS
jgi:hypothetical protein